MSSSSFLRSSLRRSSSLSVLRSYRIQRADTYSTSTANDSSSSSSVYTSDCDIAQFLKAVTGIIASGSVLGLWLVGSSFSSSSESVASLSEATDLADAHDDFSLVEKKPKYLFGDAYRRRVFFNYEKRLRIRSPPEKVFEYFASRTLEGERYMTPADLMRAVVPVFPPSESNLVREGYLQGERRPGSLYCPPSEFFMLFDTNNDGLISFPEYIFFVTLLSIPESSFSVAFKMFDLDNNGQGASHSDGKRTGFRTSNSIENGGLVEHFFGKDGSGSLQHERFVEFLGKLHNEIVRLEFAHYDCSSRGTISAKDFALSMVAAADIKHLNKFLDRVDELESDPHFRDTCITLEEFKAFAELRRKLQPLALAMFSYGKVNGLLTKSDFQRAASQVCGISLTNNVTDVIFHMFDTDKDGSLSSEEFLHALQRRENDIRQPMSTGIAGLLSCWLNCASCSLKQILP